VAAGGGLVEVGLVGDRLQFRRHLASMAGVHAIVAPACRDQDWPVAPGLM
jgi:hypothetical protein